MYFYNTAHVCDSQFRISKIQFNYTTKPNTYPLVTMFQTTLNLASFVPY